MFPIKLKYCGPAKDYSGYGEANRHDIAALVSAGIEITTQLPQYTMEVADFGALGDVALKHEGKQIGYKIKILHTTPNVFGNYMEHDKYHIGRLFWETDKIPLDFAQGAQMMDELWTGSEYNKKAIQNCGVTKPIYIIPEAIDTKIGEIRPYVVDYPNDYKFYSIFEWTERKNPGALLEAYWREFENTEGVSLTLKTYVDNFGPEKKDEVKQNIRLIKKKLNLKRYAPLYLFTQLMDRHQIYRFHKTFDCLISTHRGEGWGIPQMEAMLTGNPVISTACGGIHEYLTDKKDAYLLPFTLAHLKENTRNRQWYTMDQKWAEVKVEDVRAAMRYVFEHKAEREAVAKAGQETVKREFSIEAVGIKMRDRLKESYKLTEPQLI